MYTHSLFPSVAGHAGGDPTLSADGMHSGSSHLVDTSAVGGEFDMSFFLIILSVE